MWIKIHNILLYFSIIMQVNWFMSGCKKPLIHIEWPLLTSFTMDIMATGRTKVAHECETIQHIV